jgi:hypothetical protein
VLVPQRRCCAIISLAEVAQVRRKVAIGGGTCRAISAMADSEITPGPLGIAETSPNAEAPRAIAVRASSGEAMQQTLIRGMALKREPLRDFGRTPGDEGKWFS